MPGKPPSSIGGYQPMPGPLPGPPPFAQVPRSLSVEEQDLAEAARWLDEARKGVEVATNALIVAPRQHERALAKMREAR